MGRISRILTTEAAAAAEPPAEMVNMESDFVVILAALLCGLICVVGMIAVARCAWLRRGISSVASRSSSQLTAAANRGVKKKNLQLLPKFTYSAATTPSSTPAGGMFAKFASTECAICLGEFMEGDEVRVLPQCGHGFHVGCIDTWLGSHSSCPSCRRILVMTRCQKCGQLAGAAPASSACGGAVAATEPDLRGTSTGESNNNRCDNNNDSVNVSSFLP